MLRDDVFAAEILRPETAAEAEEWLSPVLESPLDAERSVEHDEDAYAWDEAA